MPSAWVTLGADLDRAPPLDAIWCCSKSSSCQRDGHPAACLTFWASFGVFRPSFLQICSAFWKNQTNAATSY